jgi:hypothetical protein
MGNQYTLGYRPTNETRAKLSAAGQGRKRTPEANARIGAARKAAWEDPDYRERMEEHNRTIAAKGAAASKAGWADPETAEKWRANRVGKTRSPEHCESIRQARLNLSPERKEARAENFRQTMALKRAAREMA